MHILDLKNSEMSPDVSVILNIHCEAVYIRRTIRSLNEAAAFAVASSIKSELVVVFDRSDDLTRDVTRSAPADAFISIRYVEVDHGSLGQARNAGVAHALGKYVWLCDADDLTSFNAIAEMYALAESTPRIAIFPECLIYFGEFYSVVKYYGDEVVTAADFVYGHPYGSRVFANRLEVAAVGFKDLRVTSGFAYEDWLFNCEMLVRGTSFRVASKTFLFYRQRKGSLLKQANAVSIGQVPHNPLFSPLDFCERVRLDGKDGSPCDIEAIRNTARDFDPDAEIFSDASSCALLASAIAIDPGIDIGLVRGAAKFSNVWPNRHWGHDYADACAIVGDGPYTDIVLLPCLGKGDGEKYVLEILHALRESAPNFCCLVIAGEAAEAHPWVGHLPDNAVFLDVFNAFPSISEHERDLLVLRLILAVTRPSTRLHLKASLFAQRWFGKFSSAIGSLLQTAFYHFSQPQVPFGAGLVEHGGVFNFISTEIGNLDWIVSDNQRIVHQNLDRFGVFQEKWHCLYAPCSIGPPAEIKEPAFRILCSSRIYGEKCSELLPRIAQEARRVIPQLTLYANGLESEADDELRVFVSTEGIEYLGPCNDFGSLKPKSFDAFLYTSAYDGLPNVVLEAMGYGLPVIAPDVGGVREAVVSGNTGWLIPSVGGGDDALVAAYVDAIVELYENWEHSQAMGRAGRDLIRQRHSLEHHRQMVGNIFLGLVQKNG